VLVWGLFPLGVFIGSFIHLGGRSGAILGGILGGILCCILFWSAPHWPGSNRLDERYQDKQATDNTVKRVQEAHIEDEIRHHGTMHRF
jgi:hypothetical protein